MNRERRDELALRRDALVARAALQRLELGAAAHQLRTRSTAARGLGALALRAAGRLAHAEPDATAPRARPWMLSAGWLMLRALRHSPTARWVAAGVLLGGAVWWVARALRSPDSAPDSAPDSTPDSTPDPASEDSG